MASQQSAQSGRGSLIEAQDTHHAVHDSTSTWLRAQRHSKPGRLSGGNSLGIVAAVRLYSFAGRGNRSGRAGRACSASKRSVATLGLWAKKAGDRCRLSQGPRTRCVNWHLWWISAAAVIEKKSKKAGWSQGTRIFQASRVGFTENCSLPQVTASTPPLPYKQAPR